MKKIVIAALSAKYIHTSLAVRSLVRFAAQNGGHCAEIAEFTINHRPDFVLAELFRTAPDVLFFSCYIWNIQLVLQLCPTLKKIMPDCAIFLGGPEVSFDSEALLAANPPVDGILRGEGELTFAELLGALESTPAPVQTDALTHIAGLTLRTSGGIVSTPERPPLDLALLPFPYSDDFSEAADKILYYESSRGCPYGCSYCLSSVERTVRFAPLSKVFTELQRFLDTGVRQVKFVDRTFNCNRERTAAIWSYLAAHDNGVTNFHFELTADLLDDDLLALLRPLRPGFFQFEIGVQSTNAATVCAINRNVDFAKLSAVVTKVHQMGNIHQHLDLIAGLPHEDYSSFARSFNDVYALLPQQLQLGFLKVLRGSPIHSRCGEFGILFSDYAPYEVLSTRWLSHGDVLGLKAVEEMVEVFYNSGRFLHSCAYLTSLFPSPFAFYESLSTFWTAGGYHRKSHSKPELCGILYAFAQTVLHADLRLWMWRLKFDLCLHERPGKLPAWLTADHNAEYRQRIIEFYSVPDHLERYLPQYRNFDPRAVYKLAHIEVFGDDERQSILFDYGRRDAFGNALHHRITL